MLKSINSSKKNHKTVKIDSSHVLENIDQLNKEINTRIKIQEDELIKARNARRNVKLKLRTRNKH